MRADAIKLNSAHKIKTHKSKRYPTKYLSRMNSDNGDDSSKERTRNNSPLLPIFQIGHDIFILDLCCSVVFNRNYGHACDLFDL